MFQNPQLMQQEIDLYFMRLEYDDNGEPLLKPKPATMTGLARAIGFRSLSSFYKYGDYTDHDYRRVIDEARMRVMEGYETKLFETGATGAIFALKNMEPETWKDKTEQVVDQRVVHDNQGAAEIAAKLTAQLERQGHTIELQPDPEEDDSWI
jgi:hypothetical protein